MQNLNFTIRKISAGWFVCRFDDTELWSSDGWSHDGPRQLLRLLTECLSGSRGEGFAVFDAEPGTYILSLHGGERTELELWYSRMSHHDWYPEGLENADILPELPGHLKRHERLLHVDDLDLYSLALTAEAAFSAYAPRKMRDRYIGNWMPFPREELTELRHALGDYSEFAIKY